MEGRAAGRDGDGLDAYDDGIDQDCDGKDADNPDRDGDGAPARLQRRHQAGRAGHARRRRRPGLRRRRRCKGRGCEFKRKRLKPSSKGVVNLKKVLKKRKLRTRAVLEIRVEAPGMTVKVTRFKMRKGKVPTGGKSQCIPPGASKRQAC